MNQHSRRSLILLRDKIERTKAGKLSNFASI